MTKFVQLPVQAAAAAAVTPGPTTAKKARIHGKKLFHMCVPCGAECPTACSICGVYLCNLELPDRAACSVLFREPETDVYETWKLFRKFNDGSTV